MNDIITKDQLSEIIKMQLIYEKNTEIRPFFEIVKDIPSRAAKNFGITVTTGSLLTFGSSFYAFRKFGVAVKDVKTALPVITSFSAIDFGVNFTITKAAGKVWPERWISTTSSSIAGAACGYIFGKHKLKPTIAGSVAGMIYGYFRNVPLEYIGIDPF
ncbi:hypothetical protein M9Y10_014179 [Tritrichomonas musculus]|uniref:NADH-ubiquinone oxidoreductase subunit B14.7 n=1 Tax=Tritrichomonas musculus TaxID=1915356 RepID=A0ABR2L0Q9_9EUKA